MIWIAILGTGAAFTIATWLVDRWGPWDRPRWWLPATLLLALALIWTGIVIGVRIGRAERVLERVNEIQEQGIRAATGMDSILVDYLGATGR